MKSAAQMKSKPMAWMKLNPPIRCRAGFHPRRGFHRRRRFVPPARVDLVEKSTAFAVLFSGPSGETRTRGILLPKKSGVPVSACFQAFPPLSARKHILSGTLTSTVSVYSERVCGINCGQAKHPECSFRRIRGVFYRLYGNSVRPKSQGLSQNKFCTAVDKEKGIEIRYEK